MFPSRRGQHAGYRALACAYRKLCVQVVSRGCTVLTYFDIYLAQSSNYLKGDCWNMHFKYGFKKIAHLCVLFHFKKHPKSTIANTKNVLNFVVILHSCTLQTVITAKGLKLGNEIFL